MEHQRVIGFFSATATAMVLCTWAPAPAMAASGHTCRNLSATIVGTSGDDVLRGTRGPDVIVGLGGNDIIYGRAGNDVICGDPPPPGDLRGSDIIHGGPGSDWIKGGAGPDTLRGGFSDDTLLAGPGYDALNGGTGDDTLRGGPGPDRLGGHNGDDRLFGGSGRDRLSGGPGEDRLFGGSEGDALGTEEPGNGPDHYHGQGGNDLLGWRLTSWQTPPPAGPVLSGGAGRDRLMVDLHPDWCAPCNITTDLPQGTTTVTDPAIDATIDAITAGFETVYLHGQGHGGEWTVLGTSDDDHFRVYGMAIIASMGEGDDSVRGGPLNDTVDGGEGNDRANLGRGIDTCVNVETRISCKNAT